MAVEDEEKYNIIKETMQQYEDIRSHGYINMFDQYGVAGIAARLSFGTLSEIAMDREAYGHLLQNFTHYMKKYGIKQVRQVNKKESK